MSFGEKKVNWSANSVSPESKLRAELQSSRDEVSLLTKDAERLYRALNGVAKELGYDFLRPEFAEASAALIAHEAKEK